MSACTIYSLHQFFGTPGRSQIYHISLSQIPYYYFSACTTCTWLEDFLKLTSWYCIHSIAICGPGPDLHQLHFFARLAGLRYTILAFFGLYHIYITSIFCHPQPVPHLPYYQCLACTIFSSIRYFFNAWPVLYMQPSHVSAHTIFTSLQFFVTPGWSHIYAITNAWPVPYLLPSGMF